MIKNVKNKTFKNHKLCRRFIDNLTMRFKRRFNNLALYFLINSNCTKVEYYQTTRDIGYTISSCKGL